MIVKHIIQVQAANLDDNLQLNFVFGHAGKPMTCVRQIISAFVWCKPAAQQRYADVRTHC